MQFALLWFAQRLRQAGLGTLTRRTAVPTRPHAPEGTVASRFERASPALELPAGHQNEAEQLGETECGARCLDNVQCGVTHRRILPKRHCLSSVAFLSHPRPSRTCRGRARGRLTAICTVHVSMFTVAFKTQRMCSAQYNATRAMNSACADDATIDAPVLAISCLGHLGRFEISCFNIHLFALSRTRIATVCCARAGLRAAVFGLSDRLSRALLRFVADRVVLSHAGWQVMGCRT